MSRVLAVAFVAVIVLVAYTILSSLGAALGVDLWPRR